MNFFKRAMTSITRRLGKTAILLALVFVLGNVIAGSISIGQSVKNTENAVLKGIVPIATVDMNYEKIQEAIISVIGEQDWDNEEYNKKWSEESQKYYLTAEKIEQIGALPSVDYFDYSSMGYFQGKDMKKYYDEKLKDYIYIPGPNDDYVDNHFQLRGGVSGDFLDLRTGIIEIVDGRTLTEDEVNSGENVMIIPKRLAEENGLHVGSVIVFETQFYRYDDDMIARNYEDEVEEIAGEENLSLSDTEAEIKPLKSYVMSDSVGYVEPTLEKTITFEFVVVGIFDFVKDPVGDNVKIDHGNSYYIHERFNWMYSSNKALNVANEIIHQENIKMYPDWYEEDVEYEAHFTPIFVLNNTEDVSEFKEQVVAIIGDVYNVVDNQSSFSDVVAPLANMSGLANIILYVGIGASLVILSLLVTLFLRDRRNEIGIYLALGERKGRVVGQILAEVLVVSIIGITLSLFSGSIISSQLSNSMIENAVIAQQEEQDNENPYERSYSYDPLVNAGYGSNITLEELAERYNVSLNLKIVLLFFGVGILTVLLSTLIPIIYILRLNPRKILM